MNSLFFCAQPRLEETRGKQYTVASERPQHLTLEHPDNCCLQLGVWERAPAMECFLNGQAVPCAESQRLPAAVLGSVMPTNSITTRALCLMSRRVRLYPSPLLPIPPLPMASSKAQLLTRQEIQPQHSNRGPLASGGYFTSLKTPTGGGISLHPTQNYLRVFPDSETVQNDLASQPQKRASICNKKTGNAH